MNERDFMMRKVMESRFALLELVLFLDTHPNDREALRAFRESREKFFTSRREFEERFGPLTGFSENPSDTEWRWVQEPWPWQ